MDLLDSFFVEAAVQDPFVTLFAHSAHREILVKDVKVRLLLKVSEKDP